jgi:hypothetical protein
LYVNQDEKGAVMSTTHRAILASLVTVLAGATMTGVAAAAAWTKQATVNPLTGPSDWNAFNAATRPAANDGWAGGYTINWPNPNRDQILLEHWNGSGWNVRATPATTGPDSAIRGMASTARNDVWAVGGTGDFTGSTSQPFAMHWNGSSWALIPTPSFAFAELESVAARTKTNAWTSGANGAGGLLEHWNGSTWSASAGAPGSGFLSAVAYVPHGTVWAVGTSSDPNTGATTTFAEHRVGGTWVRTPTPNPLDTDSDDVNQLDGVTALSPNDAWAVGTVGNEDTGVPYWSFILHWNGSKWHRVASPSPDPRGDPLSAVLARGTNDVWAAGYGIETGIKTHAVVEHWNGATWTERAIHEGFFSSLAMNPANGRLWAAGYTDANDHVNTLLEAHS